MGGILNARFGDLWLVVDINCAVLGTFLLRMFLNKFFSPDAMKNDHFEFG